MNKQTTISDLAVSIAAMVFNKSASASEALEILDIAGSMVRIQAGREALQQSQPSSR